MGVLEEVGELIHPSQRKPIRGGSERKDHHSRTGLAETCDKDFCLDEWGREPGGNFRLCNSHDL